MKNILVVVDMQKDFVDGSLGTQEAVSIREKVSRKIEEFQGLIIVTYDTHSEDYLDTPEGRKLPVEHCIKGTDGWKLDDCVAKALEGKSYISVEKPTFGSVELPSIISEAVGDEEFSLELVGLCTDICVVSNALLLKANFPEKAIIVDAACCAGVTVQTHKDALSVMKMCQIDVINE